jgi:uncharacterized protein YbbK (DUF523 family)
MKPRVGISSCLLGRPVRYDGGHKRDDWIVRTLSRRVAFVPVCPELELGLGVPREPIRLERGGRLVGVESRRDHTAAMRRFAEARVAALAALGLSGYILKSKSPSCGKSGVRVRGGGASPGAFAAVLLARLPDLPVEDEARLADPRVSARFLRLVLVRHRLRRLFAGRWTPARLARFLARERRLSPPARAELHRLVEGFSVRSSRGLEAAYAAAYLRFMSGV